MCSTFSPNGEEVSALFMKQLQQLEIQILIQIPRKKVLYVFCMFLYVLKKLLDEITIHFTQLKLLSQDLLEETITKK